MLSLITCTIREEPRFDWLADSLAHALAKLRSHDLYGDREVELIVVDGRLWYNGDRGEQLTAALENLCPDLDGVTHVPPKPSAWQGPTRKTSFDHFDLNNARNTGLAHANYDHVVFFDDNCVLGENFLVEHAKAAARGIALCGTFQTYTRATVEDGRALDGELHPQQDTRGTEMCRATGGWLYGLNMSFPLTYAVICNGFDEKYSGQGGCDDVDLGVRLERAGCKFVFNPWCSVFQILESHTDLPGWGVTDENDGKMKERVLADGIPHFANEWLIQELGREPGRFTPLGNDFFLTELMQLARAKKPFPVKRAVESDWRDGQKLVDM